MTDPFEKFAQLRVLFPEDIARIQEDERRVSELLKLQEYSQLEGTQKLLALCRKDVLYARKRLATNRTLNEEARRELWAIVDARLWVIEMIGNDFEAELSQIERELDAELST